ncbi:hypothetical protein BAE44_0016005, partial [Dichanthelium oligosanthes]
LVGRCFNCLRADHVAAACTYAARCLRCHREGHQARTCKRPRSPNSLGPRIIPRTSEVVAAEDRLATSLVALVGGTGSSVSVAQFAAHLGRFYQVQQHEVQIRRYLHGGFLLSFVDGHVADRVLHTPPPVGAELIVVLQRWRRQSWAGLAPLCFKVLLSVENVPAHLWSVNTIQLILGSSCLVFEPSPRSAVGSDLSCFLVVAWAVHPDMIPHEVICYVPEPDEPFSEGAPPLFLRATELIHSRRDALHYRVVVRILELHDFSLPSDSDDSPRSSGSSGADGLPTAEPGRSQPWPRIYRGAEGPSSTGEPRPSLPTSGGGTSWPSLSPEKLLVACRPPAASTGVPVASFWSASPVQSEGEDSGQAPDPQLPDLEPRCFAVDPPAASWPLSGTDPMLDESQLGWEGAPLSTAADLLPVTHCPSPILSDGLGSVAEGASPAGLGIVAEDASPPAAPMDLASFSQAVRKPLGPSILQSPPPLRRPRRRAALQAPPRRSSRLARKAVRRTPALVAAQNLLMRKLRLSGEAQLETANFDRYIQLFQNGLSEDQTKLIGDLFVCSVPDSADLVRLEEET